MYCTYLSLVGEASQQALPLALVQDLQLLVVNAILLSDVLAGVERRPFLVHAEVAAHAAAAATHGSIIAAAVLAALVAAAAALAAAAAGKVRVLFGVAEVDLRDKEVCNVQKS